MTATEQLPLFGAEAAEWRPWNTAIARRGPSPLTQRLHERAILPAPPGARVLDYGCGHGADVAFLRRCGYAVDGYDPHPPFGFPAANGRAYDAVLCLFVLNVLAEPAARREVCGRLLSATRAGGLIFLAARSPAEIGREASAKRWAPHGDGYLSSASRRTFQVGLTREDLLGYFPPRAGLTRLECPVGPTGASVLLLRRAGPAEASEV